MGNRWGVGKGNGEGRGQFTSNLGPKWTGIAPRAKEGFEVSKRDLGTGEGFSRQRGGILQAEGELPRGIVKGLSRGLCHVPDIMSTLYISCYYVYVVLIKKNCV